MLCILMGQSCLIFAQSGSDAPWRAAAQWDQMDETGTADIHKFTTDPKYITPMVSYIPEHPTVPSPRDILGHIVGADGFLTRVDAEYAYFGTLAAALPRVINQELGLT